MVESTEGAETTTIDAQHLGRVVTFEGREDTTTVLRGFTITGGDLDRSASAVFGEDCAPLVCSNRITHNGYPDPGSIILFTRTPTNGGPVVFCHNHVVDNESHGETLAAAQSSNVHCLENTFSRNSGDAAVNYFYSSKGILRGNTIYRQTGGHGILSGSADLLIEGNTIAYCDFSGIVATDHSPQIIGNLISGNGSVGIYTSKCYEAYVTNNTIVENGSSGMEAFYTTIEAVNNIVVGNGVGLRHQDGIGAYVLFKNNVAFNRNADYSGPSPGATDLHFSPGFRDSLGSDFRLSVDSPVLDMGSTVEGWPGSGPAPDIGAQEYPYPESPGTDVFLSIHPVIFRARQAVVLVGAAPREDSPHTVRPLCRAGREAIRRAEQA